MNQAGKVGLALLLLGTSLNACMGFHPGRGGMAAGVKWSLSGSYQGDGGLYAEGRLSNRTDQRVMVSAGREASRQQSPGSGPDWSAPPCDERTRPRLSASAELRLLADLSPPSERRVAKEPGGLALGVSGTLAKGQCERTELINADLSVPLDPAN